MLLAMIFKKLPVQPDKPIQSEGPRKIKIQNSTFRKR